MERFEKIDCLLKNISAEMDKLKKKLIELLGNSMDDKIKNAIENYYNLEPEDDEITNWLEILEATKKTEMNGICETAKDFFIYKDFLQILFNAQNILSLDNNHSQDKLGHLSDSEDKLPKEIQELDKILKEDDEIEKQKYIIMLSAALLKIVNRAEQGNELCKEIIIKYKNDLIEIIEKIYGQDRLIKCVLDFIEKIKVFNQNHIEKKDNFSSEQKNILTKINSSAFEKYVPDSECNVHENMLNKKRLMEKAEKINAKHQEPKRKKFLVTKISEK